MTTPIENERVATSHHEKIYESVGERAKPVDAAPSKRRAIHLIEGAAFGAAFWLLLFTLGVPWVFHWRGLSGLLPSAFICAGLATTRWRWLARSAVLALSLLLLIVAYTPVVAGPARSLIRIDDLPSRADAIMVLSAGTNDDGVISPQAMDRMLTGLELYNRGLAPVLMVSREADVIDGRLVTSRADQLRIISMSPAALSSLVVVGITHSTHDEAIRARDIVRARGWKQIIVVTSPFHTRRACATFEKAGMAVACAASTSSEIALKRLSGPDDRVKAFQIWLYEWFGTLRYRQLGWI